MSDVSNPSAPARASTLWWLALKKAPRRFQDWFAIQSMAIQFTMLAQLKLLTEYLVGKLLATSEMSLSEALVEIRIFEATIVH